MSTNQTRGQNNSPLKYDVLLEQTKGNGYTARLLAWPDTVVEAPTREKALQQMRVLILERLAKAEIVTLEIQPTEIGHSWVPFAGDWANNPYMDEFRAEIERYRREVDAIHAPWLLDAEEAEEPTTQTEKEIVHVVPA